MWIKRRSHLLHFKQEPLTKGLVVSASQDVIHVYIDKYRSSIYNDVNSTSCWQIHMTIFWQRIVKKWFPLKSVTGKMFPAFPAHAQLATLRIWKEVHGVGPKWTSSSGEPAACRRGIMRYREIFLLRNMRAARDIRYGVFYLTFRPTFSAYCVTGYSWSLIRKLLSHWSWSTVCSN